MSAAPTLLVPSIAVSAAASQQQQRPQQRRFSTEHTESTFSTRSPTDQTEQHTRKESSSTQSTPFESENVSPENARDRPDSVRVPHLPRNRLPTLASIEFDEEPEELVVKEHSQVTFGKPSGGDDEANAPHQVAAAKLHASAAAQKRANDERMKALAVLQSREKTRETSGFSLSGGALGERESPSGVEKSTMRTRARSASLQRRPYYYIPEGRRDYIESALNAWQKRAGASFEDVAREALALTRGLRQRTWIHRVNHAARLMRAQVRKVLASEPSSIVDAASARFASHTALPAVAERH